ncbi:FAD-dependent oxidoreductase [Novosphingobium sp.]|uniref:FAD-dependent oxidoreductase n=1 Tax=Novosphingobium sp. TaxID=1874826 RepID=UPI003D1042EF
MFSDKDLGMHRPIQRRDFLNGALVSGAALMTPGGFARARTNPGPYPPALTGMRGSGYPAAYSTGHALRDHTFAPTGRASETADSYDLIVVGGGISGLAAAWFYQQRHGGNARVLIIDNHDDFGGHAKRNEFGEGAKMRLSNAGSFNIFADDHDSGAHVDLYRTLGIDIAALARDTVDPGFYARMGMGQGVFFDRETFGRDVLLPDPAPWTDFSFLYSPNVPPDADARWARFMADAPLPARAKADIHRLYHAKTDYLAGMSTEEKVRRLDAMSYADYLTGPAGCDAQVVAYLRDRTFGSGRGLSSTTALSAHQRFGLPGFAGLGLLAAYDTDESGTSYHFPEGNATVARLLVGRLIPGALRARDPATSMLERVDYTRLDDPGNPTRLRLNATAYHVANTPGGVEVSYTLGGVEGRLHTTRAKHCVLACWNYVIPYICPDLPAPQREALAYNVKTPNLWVNVWLNNWRAFHQAGTCYMNAPGSYYASLILEQPVSIGGYAHSATPDDPTVMTMLRGYETPGLPIKDQFRLGRAEMYATTFDTFERETRTQLARSLGAHGFDPARDIAGLTVNRWGHGYSYWYSPLYDDFLKTGGPPPHLAARQRFGAITIANTDSGGTDTTELAIDMAARAVAELG